MPLKSQSVTVMRFWHRMSGLPEVEELSHAARWWLYGVTFQWTGFNNGIIEFARLKHGKRYGLDDSRVFARARQDVLDTGLVEVTRHGGPNLPTLYFLTRAVRQASPPSSLVTTSPNSQENPLVTTSPNAAKNRVTTTPNLGDYDTKENRPALKIARASEYRTEISDPTVTSLTECQADDPANEEGLQGKNVGRPLQSNGTAL